MNRLTDILSLEDNFVAVSSNYKFYFGGAYKNQNEPTNTTVEPPPSPNVIIFQFPKHASFITYTILKIPYPEHLNYADPSLDSKQISVSTQNNYIIKNIENRRELLHTKWMFQLPLNQDPFCYEIFVAFVNADLRQM